MATFSHFALQKAIYQQLTGDDTLMGLVTGLFDRPVQGTAFPYITIGDSIGLDWSNAAAGGMEHKFIVHIWSREGGRKEAARIMERIHALLHQQNPAVEDNSVLLLRFVSSAIVLENDGWTYHGQMHFHALLQSQS